MKDGTTHLAYKQHAVDLDGAVWRRSAPGREGATTLPKTLAAAEANLEAMDVAPTCRRWPNV